MNGEFAACAGLALGPRDLRGAEATDPDPGEWTALWIDEGSEDTSVPVELVLD